MLAALNVRDFFIAPPVLALTSRAFAKDSFRKRSARVPSSSGVADYASAFNS